MFNFFKSDREIEEQIDEKDSEIKEVVASEEKYAGLLQRAKSYFLSNEGRLRGDLKQSLGTLFRLSGSYLSGTYRELPLSTLSIVAFGLLYFISPFDMIPDALVPLGFVDDAFVLAWVVKRISGELTKFRSWERVEECRHLLQPVDHREVKHLFLVGGWFSKTADYREHLNLVQELYPEAKAEHFTWESNGMWDAALNIADTEAPGRLRERLLSVPAHRTAIIAHSLGARVTLRTLKTLEEPLFQVTLMGAAIDHDDPDISEAVLHVRNDILNFHSRSDGVLRYLYQGYQGCEPLGLSGTAREIPGIVNLKVAGTEEHLYAWIENLAHIRSLLQSKVPINKIHWGSELLENFGSWNKHQFLEYLQFLKRIRE